MRSTIFASLLFLVLSGGGSFVLLGAQDDGSKPVVEVVKTPT